MVLERLRAEHIPFVVVFDAIGIAGAAGIVNFVVLTAATSACDSGIFSSGRMLYTLARQEEAPRRFRELSARHVPAHAITASAVVLLVGVVINYLVPEEAFTYITSVATVGTLWTWG